MKNEKFVRTCPECHSTRVKKIKTDKKDFKTKYVCLECGFENPIFPEFSETDLFCSVCLEKGKKTKLKKYVLETKEFGKDEFFFCPLCDADRWPCETSTKEELEKLKK